jgi:hypothetical protein
MKHPFSFDFKHRCFANAYLLIFQAEERLGMVAEKRRLIEEKRSAEEEMKKQEKWAQEVILNKTKNARPKLSFGFRSKDGL